MADSLPSSHPLTPGISPQCRSPVETAATLTGTPSARAAKSSPMVVLHEPIRVNRTHSITSDVQTLQVVYRGSMAGGCCRSTRTDTRQCNRDWGLRRAAPPRQRKTVNKNHGQEIAISAFKSSRERFRRLLGRARGRCADTESVVPPPPMKPKILREEQGRSARRECEGVKVRGCEGCRMDCLVMAWCQQGGMAQQRRVAFPLQQGRR